MRFHVLVDGREKSGVLWVRTVCGFS
jgi:hypothetical protein